MNKTLHTSLIKKKSLAEANKITTLHINNEIITDPKPILQKLKEKRIL
jgi:NifU-like protein involved in Fe-S cluster formation